jgi:hypothetical protein
MLRRGTVVETGRRFKCSLDHHGYDGGSKHLWNVGKFLPDNAEQYSRYEYVKPSLENNCSLHTAEL